MNLVLIGYRGTGKSTIGRLVAETLEMAYIGFDQEIIKRAGMSIPEIVEKHSWEFFRDLESSIAEDYGSKDNQVLDTGGGVIIRKQNTTQLKKNGVIFLLEAEIADILLRIGVSEDRPSLTGSKSFLEEVEEVLEARQPLYQAAADYVIDTSRMVPDQAVVKIIGQFKEYVQAQNS